MATHFNAIEIDELIRGDGAPSRVSVRLATTQNCNWTTSADISITTGVLTITDLTAGTTLGRIDGIEVVSGDRILIKDAGAASAGAAANNGYNGIWTVIGGDDNVSIDLIRAADLEDGDSTSMITVWTLAGTVNTGTSWVCVTNTVVASNGTNANLWTRYDVTGTLETSRGGTGVTTFGGTNTLLYTSSADTLASLTTANSSVLVTNGSGVPSLATTLPEGLTANSLEGFSLNDATTAAYDLSLIADSSATAMTADRSLTFDVNNANRVIDLSGDLTLGGAFTTTAGNSVTFTTTGATNVTLPTSGTLANEAYVDSVAQGLDVKDSCRLATEQNANWTGAASIAFSTPTLTISALTAGTSRGLIDGIEPVNGDRILIKDAGAASAGAAATDVYNGIWSVTGGTTTTLTLIRSTDANTDAKVTAGMFTFIEEGTCADCGFVLSTNDPITLDTTALVFSQFSSAGTVIAGDGLDKTGNTLSVDLKANGGLVIESTEIAVDLSATNITGTLAVGDGGTGLTSVAANGILYGAGTSALSVAAAAANSVLATNGSSVPSLTTTLPTAVQGNITSTGTISSGTWNGSTIGVAYGGTGKTSITSNALIYGQGTSAPSEVSPAASSVLVSNGSSVPGWNTTLPSGLTIPSPKITTGIFDANTNELITFTPTASAVNYVDLTNAATGTNPVFTAAGSDTDIGLNFVKKSAGTFNFITVDEGGLPEIRLVTGDDGFIAFKPANVGSDTATYTWPLGPAANGHILSSTTGGFLSWNAPSSILSKRDFTLLTNLATTTGTTEVAVGYLPWDESAMTGYSTRTVTLWHVTGTKVLTADLYDGTSVLGSITTTASTSGIATFTFTAPGSDKVLSFRIKQASNGNPRPQVFGATITLS